MDALTDAIIGNVFTVHNRLGCGFLEKVYENALVHELRKNGFYIDQQQPITVRYDGVVVGEYIADIVVNQQVLLELKVVKALDSIHAAQCLNYLRATGIKKCLLLNFAKPKAEIRRFML